MSEEGIDRKKLYELVWNEPISTLSDRFGYSDVGFSKLCRKHGIPLPARGHWARVKAGQKIRQPPLPPAKSKQGELLLKPLPQKDQELRGALRAQQAVARRSISPEAVAAEAGNLHSLARAAQKRLKQKDGWADAKQLRAAPKEILDIEVTKDSIDRAVLIASVIARELEHLGAVIRVDEDKGGTALQLLDARIGLKITEHVARTDHVETPAEQRALDRYRNSISRGIYSADYPQIPRHDFTPTGLLTITASGWPVRNWRDTKRTPLEQRLGEVVAGIVVLAEEVRDREAEAARKRAEHAAKVERYQSEMTRRSDERKAFRALRADARKWVTANQIREYLQAAEQAEIKRTGSSDSISQWLEWGARKADWLDPTVRSSDAILDAPEPERPGYSYW